MADFSRETREHWLKQHFSKNEVAKSGDRADLEMFLAPESTITVSDQ